ncbi:MAG: DUF3160 domain-containing protein [Candidatus Moraniibacteriota bacterium]
MENNLEKEDETANQNIAEKTAKHNLAKIVAVIIAAISIAIILIFLNNGFEKYSLSKNLKNNNNVTYDNDKAFDPQKSLVNLENLRSKYSFPSFEYKKSEFNPSVPEEKIELSELKNMESFSKNYQGGVLKPIIFSDTQRKALEDKNFFIVKNEDKFFDDNPDEWSLRTDDWTSVYEDIGGSGSPQNRLPDNSVFITSDFILHVYHKLVEKEFKYIEQKEFYPRLLEISKTMLDASMVAYNNSKKGDSEDTESYQRLITYFAVPNVILSSSYDFYKNELVMDDSSDSKEAVLLKLDEIKNNIPTESYNLAKQEIELIMDAESVKTSPLFGPYINKAGVTFDEDYTQYGPRSHYGENPILRSYWRSMMWFGRQNFFAKSEELTRDAINIVLLMESTSMMSNWEDIYIPTSFFVGESDDLGIYDYKKIMFDNKSIPYGKNLVDKVQNVVKELEGPQIMSSMAGGDKIFEMSKDELQNETKGFRFMGQRFTPDAFIFSSLTQGDEMPDPETGEKLPSMPTALMIMSSIGNETANPYLEDWIISNAPNSKNVINNRIESIKKYFGNLTLSSWTQNIYWGWLYTLRSLSQENLDKKGYPNFMKNESWDDKNLQAALGSWTELKHDTLLYAKQSYAEMGGGGPEGEIPPVPKGYVEPNIEFWDRIIPLVKMTKAGLEQRNLLDQEFQARNDNFIDALEFFRKIAIAELNNEVIQDNDFEKLRLLAGNLDSVIAPLPNEERTEGLARSALIADVHTDGLKREILYQANGIPNYIYVAVRDTNGTRLTKGLVYSYYEFKNPLEKRLTDSDWKEWIYTQDESKIPEQPFWIKSLMK